MSQVEKGEAQALLYFVYIIAFLVQYVRFAVFYRCCCCCCTAAVLRGCFRSSKEVRVGIVQVVMFRMVCPHNTHMRVHTEAPFVAVTIRRP